MSAAILEARKKAEKAAAAALSTPKKVAAENCSSSIGSRVTPKRSLESAGAGDGSIASVSPYTPKPGRPATGASTLHIDDDAASHAPEQDDIYVSFLHEAATAGIAFYSSANGSISTTSVHCAEADIPWVIGVMKDQITQPTMIVTSSHISEAARRELGKRVQGAEVFEDAIAVKVAKHATFSLDLSRKLLVAVCGGGGHAAQLGSFLDANDGMQLRAAGGLLHFLLKSKVISELDASSGGDDISGSGGGGSICALPGGIRMYSLSEMMQLDSLTFSALSIFAKESHPALSGGGRAKEGFSLNALLDRTVSPPGKRLLRSWCLQPSLDAEVLLHRHDAVGFLMGARAQTPELWKELKGYLKKVKDLPRLLVRIKAVKAGPGDWFGLAQTILAGNMIRDHLHLMLGQVRAPDVISQSPGGPSTAASARSGGAGAGGSSSSSFHQGQGLPPHPGDPLSPSTPYSVASPFLLRQVLREFGPDLTFLQTTLDAIIDWEASRGSSSSSSGAASSSTGRLAVQPGLDARLDEYRRTYADLPNFLSQVSLTELERYPTLTSLQMKYLPQIGVVVEVNKAENGLAPATADVAAAAAASGGGAGSGGLISMVDSARAAAVVPPDFELSYETAGELLFKSPKARELDGYFGDIAGVISDLESSILRQLEEKVLEYEGLLLTVGQRLAEVDVLTSFAEVSQDYRYVRPRIRDEPVLLVKGARHPLQELTVEAFVPNDIAMAPGGLAGGTGGALCVVTGPNFSGKSVYLKTIGLIPYMAQIGCYVPAEKAVVGLVDRIFTRIASLESTSLTQQSTFTIDLNQVGLMLRHATPRSLLLIDEFGKGTSSIDGVSLLASTIRTLLCGAAVPSPLPLPLTSASSSSSLAGGGRRLPPPKTVITTHFREVFDFDLLGLEGGDVSSGGGDDVGRTGSSTSAAGDSSSRRGGGGGGTAASGIPGLPPLPPSSAREVAFFQMQVVLDKEAQKAAVEGRATPQSLGERDDDADDAGSVRTDVTNSNNPDDLDDTVVPLFRLVPGRAASSYGLDCARKGGIPRPVVDRARVVTSCLTSTGSVPPAPLPPQRAGARDERGSAQLSLAKVLLSVPDWNRASPQELIAALRAIKVANPI